MISFAFLLKTYAGDFRYAERLLQSYRQFNCDAIQLFLVAPRSDVSIFEKIACENVTIIPEDEVSDQLVTDNSVLGIAPGYINQEIIKLSFWELGAVENYFCLDSDAYFIRNFFRHDFMYDDSTPYTVLAEDKDLRADPLYYRKYWAAREKWVDAIKVDIALTDRRSLTCHGLTTLSSRVLRSLKDKHMRPNGKSYSDLLRIAPLEFSWYSLWLQKDRTIPIEIQEPPFKTFHMRRFHQEFIARGVTAEDLSRAYVGVVINSNFSRDFGLVSYDSRIPYGFFGINVSTAIEYIRVTNERIGTRLGRRLSSNVGRVDK